MPSRARIAANRRNAEKSTGPKTVAGKAKVARNAVKHGLAVPVAGRAALAANLAGLLTGSEKEPLTYARLAADAELELLRVRRARAELGDADPVTALERIERYERRALSRRKAALRALYDWQA